MSLIVYIYDSRLGCNNEKGSRKNKQNGTLKEKIGSIYAAFGR